MVVCHQPSMWNGGFEHHGKTALLVIDGCRDSAQSGLALFPEILKSELHGTRAVLEAHSDKKQISGRKEASACGLRVGTSNWPTKVRLTTASGVVSVYEIDRWE